MPGGGPTRRAVGLGAVAVLAEPAAASSQGEKLASAARRQLGVTTGYDPAYRKLAYPGGDVPRATGVCCDVVIRAARDGLGLDLQALVHEDMRRAFAAYPSHRRWGLTAPDRNIDHRRVPNLETYWTRAGARIWRASGWRLGSDFDQPMERGDILTWLVNGSLPHVAVVVSDGRLPRIVHNIGDGVREDGLIRMLPHRPVAHFRWPKA